jgi:hypothetical protein
MEIEEESSNNYFKKIPIEIIDKIGNYLTPVELLPLLRSNRYGHIVLRDFFEKRLNELSLKIIEEKIHQLFMIFLPLLFSGYNLNFTSKNGEKYIRIKNSLIHRLEIIYPFSSDPISFTTPQELLDAGYDVKNIYAKSNHAKSEIIFKDPKDFYFIIKILFEFHIKYSYIITIEPNSPAGGPRFDPQFFVNVFEKFKGVYIEKLKPFHLKKFMITIDHARTFMIETLLEDLVKIERPSLSFFVIE